MTRDDILHKLIDFAGGLITHGLSAEEVKEAHEAIDPHYNDEPLSPEDEAKLAELQARQDFFRQQQAATPAAPAPVPSGDVAAVDG